MSACRCPAIQAADPLRHFTDCPLREPLPEGHPAAGSCVKPDPFAAEIAAEADRIEADNAAHPEWPRLTVEETWHGCNSALDDARLVGPGGEVLHPSAERRHYYLVRHAAWALVALRAEAREMAAKGGGA